MASNVDGFVGLDTDALATAIKEARSGIAGLAAPPGALPAQAREQLIDQVETQVNFIEACAFELRTQLRAARASAAKAAPTGILENPAMGWPNFTAQVDSCYADTRALFDSRRGLATEGGHPHLSFERERLVQLMVCVALERAISAVVPGEIANIGVSAGFDLEMHIRDEGHEPAFHVAGASPETGEDAK